MDSRYAREILMRYRPGRPDEADAEMTEALELARHDPVLGQWFERHCELQSIVRDQLQQIAVPADLRHKILAGHATVPNVVWWRRPVFQTLAAAASIALLAASVWFASQPREDNSFAAYRNRMVRTARRMYRMDMVTNDLAQIRLFLGRKQAHADYVAPARLETLPGDGCAILHWHGIIVSLVCYDLGDHNDLYYFVVNRADFPDAPASAMPQFAKVSKLMTASWSQGGKTYVLAGPGDEKFLRRYLENSAPASR